MFDQPQSPGLWLANNPGRGGPENSTLDLVFQQNINLDLVNELQGRGPGRQVVHVELAHDETGAFEPFGMPRSDDPIPNQRFPAAHSKRHDQSAAVFGNRFQMEEETNGRVRAFRRPLQFVLIHPPMVFQPSALVLVEFEVALLQLAANLLSDFNVGAGREWRGVSGTRQTICFSKWVRLVRTSFLSPCLTSSKGGRAVKTMRSCGLTNW